jgi:hypothetical protein
MIVEQSEIRNLHQFLTDSHFADSSAAYKKYKFHFYTACSFGSLRSSPLDRFLFYSEKNSMMLSVPMIAFPSSAAGT